MLPADELAFTRGAGEKPFLADDLLVWPPSPRELWEKRQGDQPQLRPPALPELRVAPPCDADVDEVIRNLIARSPEEGTLHEAMLAYIA